MTPHDNVNHADFVNMTEALCRASAILFAWVMT